MAKKAFTLAEVLVTLGIIGVVAALTLPALINSTQNRELQSQLQVAYSELQQGLSRMNADKGYTVNESYYPNSGSFYNDYKNYFVKIYDCGFLKPNEELCMSRTNNHGDTNSGYNDTVYKTFNGNTLGTVLFDDGQFILSNGMLVIIQNNGTQEILLTVDINGKKKKPNRLGQDLFTFQLMNNGKLIPMGANGTKYGTCTKSSTSDINGIRCTYRALTDKTFWKNLPK